MRISESKDYRGRFEKTPQSLMFLYNFLPGYKAEMTTLYNYITHFYNEDEGYAWPNVDTLAFYLGCSGDKVSQMLTFMHDNEIIRVESDGAKKRFIPLPLIEDEAGFFARYPQAREEYEKRADKRNKERAKSAENMRKHRRRKKAQERGEEIVKKAFDGAKETNDESIPYRTETGEIVDLRDWF